MTPRITRLAAAVGASAALALGGSLAVAAPAHAGATGIYKNCDALHSKYKHGVGKVGARDRTSGTPVTTFTRSTKAYNAAMSNNKRLDADKDGIACEHR